MKLILIASLALTAALPLRAADVPEKSEIKKMELESMTAFGEALKEKDFTTFHEGIAEIWQKQITAEQLMDSFKSVATADFDILGIVKELKPTFEPDPAINSDGVLVVKGYYPTKPNHLNFQLKYYQEEDAWKLVGINVKTDDAAK